ncbi:MULTISPECIES: DUF2075 domain-containing protein [Asticcacaulis]|uniref:DUF2075 domain-containing protein n=1 Tax=Asticcacaulis TaxID=76890 RepID=UPI001AE2DBF3|nr:MULTISPECIES: DUF2075 domain-containing protein [Asticcacaulis]MBP2157861.1 hypothetical protein [Asticcacaulis solisilvae]MDR6798906.1 hypothetical protein [Asticcacaulis sp. BE141]
MRAYYTADRARFESDTDDHILGELTRRHNFALEIEQKSAWLQQIRIMRNALAAIDAYTLAFEFSIPRMGKRADAVLVIGDCIFVIEFKVGAETFDRHAIEQVEDYALDLKNFHEGSHALSIIPVLVPTKAPAARAVQLEMALAQVARPVLSSVIDLADIIRMASAYHRHIQMDAAAWAASGYRPTPTIIQAAQALYANHNVEEITRRDAGAINLTRTEAAIGQVIDDARANGWKAICFITGVPGAGKTLAGLNVATKRSEDRTAHATYLTGNGPLIQVLQQALARDQAAREDVSRAFAHSKVRAFIQNIHEFRDEYATRSQAAPSDHVVVFDEAQRAWTRAQASSFMQRKKGVADFDMSEPEFLLSVMDRHPDWCTVVCLIGGGQEINTGEAGLSEWMAAIRDRFPHWRVHASAQIVQPDYDLNADARIFIEQSHVSLNEDLHLSVSMRSFRAETLSAFIAHVLNGDVEAAKAASMQLNQYPLFVTRDLRAAKDWLRTTARGSERYGLVASSGAHRLRPEGLHVKAGIDPANWFLNDRNDVRSSFYMEEVASEFDVQGLELDYAAVCWDADLRYNDGWQSWNFKGTRWQAINDRFRRLYLRNAYRVILTRARQGMTVFVPKGDAADATRPPDYYDGTYDYLIDCGFTPLV